MGRAKFSTFAVIFALSMIAAPAAARAEGVRELLSQIQFESDGAINWAKVDPDHLIEPALRKGVEQMPKLWQQFREGTRLGPENMARLGTYLSRFSPKLMLEREEAIRKFVAEAESFGPAPELTLDNASPYAYQLATRAYSIASMARDASQLQTALNYFKQNPPATVEAAAAARYLTMAARARTGLAATGVELAALVAPVVFVAGVGYYGVAKPMAAGAVPKGIDVLANNSLEKNRLWQLAHQLTPQEQSLARQISDQQVKEALREGKLWYGDSYVLPASYVRDRVDAAEEMVRKAR